MVSPLPDTSTRKANTPVYQLDRLGFQYGEDKPALIDISFRIEPGERVALMGANGCGKSTLLKILGGLQFATSGRIEAFGKCLEPAALEKEQDSYAFRRRVGFIFQNSDAQLFSSSVEEEIAFGPLHMGLSKNEVKQRIADIAQFTQIEHLLQRAPFQLSGGEKKRVSLASVLVCNPDVLLMDEPSAALDPRAQTWLINLLRQLSSTGKTIVIATHDLDTVAEVAQRALIFRENHTLAADIPAYSLKDEIPLLIDVNLIHEHVHYHGSTAHSHPHTHDKEHQHMHE